MENTPIITDRITAIATWIGATWTTIAAVFAVVIYMLNKKKDQQKYWNNNLPVITVWSPCDVSQVACNIDITKNENNNPNWSAYFQVWNFSKTTAWDLKILISDIEGWWWKNDRELYMQEVPVTILVDENWFYIWKYIYSNYHIDPKTRKMSLTPFQICEFLKDCKSDERQPCNKEVYIMCNYFSSPDNNVWVEIQSKFKALISCDKNEWTKILSVIRLDYTANFPDSDLTLRSLFNSIVAFFKNN